MWNDGKYILWQHIAQLFYEDTDNGLKLLPKLSQDHIKLNSYSVMRVNLAAQEYFGNQRKLGKRCDNPDIRMFGYNENSLRIQRSVSIQSGNTQGRKDKRRAWENVSNDPVPKRGKKLH